MKRGDVSPKLVDAIHFYKVDDLDAVRRFYGDILGLTLYKDQGTCLIYSLDGHGRIGFCTHHPKRNNDATCITFVYESKCDVDAMHTTLKTRIDCVGTPSLNERFKIYHFFAEDFNGLTVEFQVFL